MSANFIAAPRGKKIVVANWKMHPTSLEQARRLVAAYRPHPSAFLVVCPPAVFLPQVSARFGKHVAFGAQDCFWESSGAYTGEISPSTLKKSGANFVILGHSERRKFLGENDTMINKKILAALAEKLSPIVCLGGGLAPSISKTEIKNIVRRQFAHAVKKVRSAQKLIFVFEPAYAISTFSAQRVSPLQASAMIAYVRKLCGDRFGWGAAAKTPILYGGSVDGVSFRDYLKSGQIDGFLVGGASLKPKEFNLIIRGS